VTVYKREGSPNWRISDILACACARSSGTTSKAEMKTLEQKWRQEIYDRVKLCKAPTITVGQA
jgi:hypothetical protein